MIKDPILGGLALVTSAGLLLVFGVWPIVNLVLSEMGAY